MLTTTAFHAPATWGDQGNTLPPRAFTFGPFVLNPARQLLLRNGVPVRIGGRAFDLLTALVERPGELLSKRELIARAWPSIFVDESNLKVNMAGLRRALGDQTDTPRFIATVVGRGYRFIESVSTAGAPSRPAFVPGLSPALSLADHI